MSGTSVKAVVGYVTDYITKGWLKTHQIFSALSDSFSKNESVLAQPEGARPGNGARQMLTKLVNALSSKMEIGAPMAALYLLRNPDHYTSHEFVPFYWKNYTNYVHAQWKALLDLTEPGEDEPIMGLGKNIKKEGSEDIALNEDEPHDMPADFAQDTGHQETVRMSRSNGQFLAKSNTDDYRLRPSQLEHICLYDFIQCSIKHPISAQRDPRRDLRWFRFIDEHPQSNSHAVALDPARRSSHVPNFIGPSLPRRDSGDKEDYSCAMLTLFCPWRTGIDLRSADQTWEETFNQYDFTTRQRELIDNFNMRYECYDARDDYGAVLKAAGLIAGSKLNDIDDNDHDDEESLFCDSGDNGENDEDDDELNIGIGSATARIQTANASMLKALRSAGWKTIEKLQQSTVQSMGLPRIALDAALKSGAWNNIIKVEKLRAWRRKIGAMAKNATKDEARENKSTGIQEVENDVYIVPSSYLSKDFVPPQEEWSHAMRRIITDFNLNQGQEKAFKIIANHALCIDPSQLLMHLGGMGGTGKSTVIRALCAFFGARDENYRFVLLGPTGTSAALIGGSTYHTYLSINTGRSKGDSPAKIEEVRE
ncbi:hypothetical protein DFP72DRAFT_824222, partial [Ephemerocybe angulata]